MPKYNEIYAINTPEFTPWAKWKSVLVEEPAGLCDKIMGTIVCWIKTFIYYNKFRLYGPHLNLFLGLYNLLDLYSIAIEEAEFNVSDI